MFNDETLALLFKSLAHPRRVRLFRLLAERPEAGQSLIELQRVTGLKKTPLVHHLREMEKSGLVFRRRRGTYVAQILATQGLLDALAEADRLARRAPGPARRMA